MGTYEGEKLYSESERRESHDSSVIRHQHRKKRGKMFDPFTERM